MRYCSDENARWGAAQTMGRADRAEDSIMFLGKADEGGQPGIS